LWLIANYKVLTRDNLSKRKHVDDVSCLFCAELETVHHLLFDYCIARLMWSRLGEISNKVIGAGFESVARLWLCDKKFKTLNICTTAVLWALWKIRNLLCFQGKKWSCMQDLYFMCAKMLRSWCLTQKEDVAAQLMTMALEWEPRGARPPRSDASGADPRRCREDNSDSVMVVNNSNLVVMPVAGTLNSVTMGLNLNGAVLSDDSYE
jgi:hypothetical protein